MGGRVSQAEIISDLLEDVLSDGILSKEIHIAIPTHNILIRKITSLLDIGENELAKLLQFGVGYSYF